MAENNSWVKWVAVIALILAVVALAVVINNGITGNAIFNKSDPYYSNNWIKNLNNISFEFNYTENNGEIYPIMFAKVPLKYVSSKYRIHGVVSSWGDGSISNQMRTNLDLIEGNCEKIEKGICFVKLRFPYSQDPNGGLYGTALYANAYLFNQQGKIVAGGEIYNAYYVSGFGDLSWIYPVGNFPHGGTELFE